MSHAAYMQEAMAHRAWNAFSESERATLRVWETPSRSHLGFAPAGPMDAPILPAPPAPNAKDEVSGTLVRAPGLLAEVFESYSYASGFRFIHPEALHVVAYAHRLRFSIQSHQGLRQSCVGAL